MNTLYRFFDNEGILLYIGITCNPGRRLAHHAEHKTWWTDVARVDMEQFATREDLAAAEVAAIRAEQPRYNVMHNGSPAPRIKRPVTPGRPVRFACRAGGARDARHRQNELLALPIWWFVQGDGVFEAAPGQAYGPSSTFLTYYGSPWDETGIVDLADLPVADKLWKAGDADKGGFIQQATGWKPQPMQPRVSLVDLIYKLPACNRASGLNRFAAELLQVGMATA